MIAFLGDEDLNARVIRGLIRRVPELDLVTAKDAGLAGTADSAIVSWASANRRVIITHDVNSMIEAALSRIHAGELMSGLIAVPQGLGIGPAISDLELVAACAVADDLEGQVWYLPL